MGGRFGGMKKKYIYMLVTKDKYELPLAVADSAEELGRILGIPSSRIRTAMSKARERGYRSRYVRVEYQGKED